MVRGGAVWLRIDSAGGDLGDLLEASLRPVSAQSPPSLHPVFTKARHLLFTGGG